MYARPCELTGSGRWITYKPHYGFIFKAILDNLAVPYSHGNDAPKGGKTGEYYAYSLAVFYERVKVVTGLDILQDIEDRISEETRRKEVKEAVKRGN